MRQASLDQDDDIFRVTGREKLPSGFQEKAGGW